METIKSLCISKKWNELQANHTLESVANELTFKEGLILVYNLLYNDDWNEDFQIYAVNLLDILKKIYPYEWAANWRNEAFLGIANDIILKYDERFHAFKQAYKQSQSPPPELLIEFARCCYSPGTPLLSYQEAINLLKKSIEIHPYKQAAALLKSIYSSMQDSQNEKLWAERQNQITDDKLPPLWPNFIPAVD